MGNFFKNRRKILTVSALFWLCTALNPLWAQNNEKIKINESDYKNQQVEMADGMRSNGKIYVVVGVVGIIFAGMLLYMVSIDRKIGRIEKEIEN